MRGESSQGDSALKGSGCDAPGCKTDAGICIFDLTASANGCPRLQLPANFKRLTITITARQLGVRVSRDADDGAVLACALAARASLIVSGDDDLLVLKQFSNIPIFLPHQALRLIGAL
jgi:hypothetical protein